MWAVWAWGLFHSTTLLLCFLWCPWHCRFQVCKYLKLLGKWNWWKLKSVKEFVLCCQVHIHFSHLVLMAILCDKEAGIIMAFYKREKLRPGLGDTNHTASCWKSRGDMQSKPSHLWISVPTPSWASLSCFQFPKGTAPFLPLRLLRDPFLPL